MKNKSTLFILLALCLFLCACGSSATAPEPTVPAVSTEPAPAALPRLTKEELMSLSKWMPISLLKQATEDPTYAETLIGNPYRFDGIIHSIEADHAVVQFSLKDRLSLFEPEVETVAAEIYLSADELASVVLGQKVVFVGRFDDYTSTEGTNRIVFYNAAIEHDRFENYGEIKELNTDYEPNTWNVQFAGSDIKPITFVPVITGTNGNSYYFSYKEIDGRYVDGYFLGPNGEMASYDPVLFDWPDILDMAAPKLTLEEVQTMILENLTLDEVAEKIDTLADLIQYLHQKGFVFGSGDLQFRYGPCIWSVNRSAQVVFEDNVGNCGGGSNLANYILRGDFEEQGYVKHSWNANGHITNYFMQDGLYYFFDLTMITNREYQNLERYEMFVTDDPQKFADDYVGRNHKIYKADSPDYLIFLSMYAREGNHLPFGYGNIQQGWPRSYYLPKEHEDIIRILHAEGHGISTFVDAPEKHLWPEEVQ